MKSGEQSAEFLELLKNKTELAQDSGRSPTTAAYPSCISAWHATAASFRWLTTSTAIANIEKLADISVVASDRHIGKNGNVYLFENGKVVSGAVRLLRQITRRIGISHSPRIRTVLSQTSRRASYCLSSSMSGGFGFSPCPPTSFIPTAIYSPTRRRLRDTAFRGDRVASGSFGGHMKRLTNSYIAKELGVSVATVSRALNDSGYVNADLKKRINEFLESYYTGGRNGYTTEESARESLIAVVLPDICNDFNTSAIRGMEYVAQQHSVAVNFFDTNEQPGNETQVSCGLSRNTTTGRDILAVGRERSRYH